MNKYIKVEGHENLLRNSSTNAIINSDDKAYSAYKKKRELQKKNQQMEIARIDRINTLEKKIDSLENTLNKILDVLENGKS